MITYMMSVLNYEYKNYMWGVYPTEPVEEYCKRQLAKSNPKTIYENFCFFTKQMDKING